MFRGILHACWLSALLAGGLGCAGRSDVTEAPDAGSDGGSLVIDPDPPPPTRSDKLDLLLVVDDSRNQDLSQRLLADAIPYLLQRLTSPACVNGLGNVVAETPSATDACPTGVRDFAPVRDMHIGVISTSLGGHGADICSPASATWQPTQDEAAHLLARAPGGVPLPTYADQGFLAWDPGQAMSPPGDADLGAFSARLADMVRGVGTGGCGFESQLESIYRFLSDPNPHASIVIEGGLAVPVGTDEVLLKQRADFLRPDSAVAVVLLTDENDCSTRDGGQYYLAAQGLEPNGQLYHLPRGRSECAASPNDPCCASCGQETPEGCPPTPSDPSCQLPPMDSVEDPVNLRCFDQKRRFGVDFLYPIDRYTRGFTKPLLFDRDGNLTENPLFAGGKRGPDRVVVAGIVGVPWQDIAADPKSIAFGFRPVPQIDWSLLFGDPATGAPPFDPLMIESIEPREGVTPTLGKPLEPPAAASPLANPINGHERQIAAKDDLQFACIYPHPVPKECSAGGTDCECVPGNIDTNPLCQAPDGSYGSMQRFARALPSVRELSLLASLGSQGVVASVCAAETVNTSHPAYGYKPAVDALLRELRRSLEAPPEPPESPEPDGE
ncbi:MAG TPA: hypothetical protein VE093_37040 [Polyangiaceae bacterium]|nr:hypothetical protein [Polyangiaceae bacterium]